jgi:2'-5' RNA ligase
VSWFIGVPVVLQPEDADLPPAAPGVVALGAADRHVTLAFLGHAADEAVMAIWARMPALALPATVRARRWERFGRRAIALVVWDDDDRLDAAAAASHRAAEASIELRSPSPFRPHVTMARIGRRARPPTSRALRDWPLPARPLAVGALTLFRSRREPSRGRYEAVERRTGPV